MKKLTKDIIEWIKNLFATTGGKTAVIGISGGKDSTVCAKLLCEALGPENVIGVMMPNGVQADIADSMKVCELLGIKAFNINIGETYSALRINVWHAAGKDPGNVSTFATNTPARIRMITLYGVAALYPGARVCNTCNRSEDYVGYSTKFGDSAGDFSPLSNLTVREVLEVGDDLGLPYELVHKTPSDGMCGKSDEDNLGFTYAELDAYLLEGTMPERLEKIERLHKMNLHKLLPMPAFKKVEDVNE